MNGAWWQLALDGFCFGVGFTVAQLAVGLVKTLIGRA